MHVPSRNEQALQLGMWICQPTAIDMCLTKRWSGRNLSMMAYFTIVSDWFESCRACRVVLHCSCLQLMSAYGFFQGGTQGTLMIAQGDGLVLHLIWAHVGRQDLQHTA